MKEKLLLKSVKQAYIEKRRLVAPLLGFPGLNLTGCTIKLAQQNYGEHFKVLKSLAETFQPDAIFPLMDLSVEANAFGRFTVFPKEESATVVKDDFSFDDVAKADNVNISFDTRLLGYIETLRMMSLGLPPSILKGAYVTGPYTLAALLMGADDAAMATIMNPGELEELCEFTTKKIMEYVQLLISAGAKIICILEPSSVMLGPDQFEQFSAKFVRHINELCSYTDVSTVYHICGNSMHLVKKMVESGANGLSLDAHEMGVDLPAVIKSIPEDVVVIGNISPVGSILYGKPEDVKREVNELLKSMDSYPNFILSTGCDLPQDVPLKNIQAFMEAGREYKLP
jgi:uroporphyrinogen decarboxylase